jgi:glutaredoxin
MPADMTHVEGTNRAKIVLYAISTCAWCRKAKALLDQLGVAYSYVDVDQLAEGDKAPAKDEVRRWNPKCSFPTIVVNDRECIVGFNERRIREALGL